MNKCDPLCVHENHPFIHLLSSDELDTFQSIGEKLFDSDSFGDPLDSHALVKTYQVTTLSDLVSELTTFFRQNATKHYFLKFSSISPKDAYCRFHGVEEEEDGEKMTQKNISFLKVGVPLSATPESTASHCIQILSHSMRIYLDVCFERIKKPLHLLLLDWNEPDLKSETRCLIANSKVVAITQYYTDLADCYHGVGEISEIYHRVVTFVVEQLPNLPSPDVSMDLNITLENLRIIELNHLAESDKCLFSKEEIDSLTERTQDDSFFPPFRYIEGSNREIKQIY